MLVLMKSAEPAIDAIGLECIEDGVDGRPVADVGPFEPVARAVADGVQRGKVSGIGQLVEVEHLVISLVHEMAADRRSDEAGSSGHDDPHGKSPACQGA
jgi:hypothetical protein